MKNFVNYLKKPFGWLFDEKGKRFFFLCFTLAFCILCIGWAKKNGTYILFCFVPMIVAFMAEAFLTITKSQMEGKNGQSTKRI